MTWKEWLTKRGMISLKIKTKFLEAEFSLENEDKSAAWELYIELLTRISTQPLHNHHGDEESALNSIHQLFPLTRNVIKNHGRNCIAFTKIAIIVLNQAVRPFTAKWHRLSTQNAFNNKEQCQIFRTELLTLQKVLLTYTKMLADMADVEDLTEFEDVDSR